MIINHSNEQASPCLITEHFYSTYSRPDVMINTEKSLNWMVNEAEVFLIQKMRVLKSQCLEGNLVIEHRVHILRLLAVAVILSWRTFVFSKYSSFLLPLITTTFFTRTLLQIKLPFSNVICFSRFFFWIISCLFTRRLPRKSNNIFYMMIVFSPL